MEPTSSPRHAAVPTNRFTACVVAMIALGGLVTVTGCGEDTGNPSPGPALTGEPREPRSVEIEALLALGRWDTGCPCADVSDPDICEPVVCELQQYFDLTIRITNREERALAVSPLKLEVLDENGEVLAVATSDFEVRAFSINDQTPVFEGTLAAGQDLKVSFGAVQSRGRLPEPGSSYQGLVRLTLLVDGRTEVVETTGAFGQTVVG